MARRVVTISISIEPSLITWLTEQAKTHNMSRSEFASLIIETHKLRKELNLNGK